MGLRKRLRELWHRQVPDSIVEKCRDNGIILIHKTYGENISLVLEENKMGKLRVPTVNKRIRQLNKQKKVTGGKAPALPPGITVDVIKPKRKKAKASTGVRAAPLPPGVTVSRKKTKAELKRDAKIVKRNKSMS